MNLLVNAPRSALALVQTDLQDIPAVEDAQFGVQSEYVSDW
jgi:hypothetical protein